METAQLNAPKEREAQRIANSRVNAKVQDNPALQKDKKELAKVRRTAITDARLETGAGSKDEEGQKKNRIHITDAEWKAIQAGAISDTQLQQILRYADPDRLRELAMPKTSSSLSSAKITKIKAMANSGYTNAEIADAMGLSTSTVSDYINKK